MIGIGNAFEEIAYFERLRFGVRQCLPLLILPHDPTTFSSDAERIFFVLVRVKRRNTAALQNVANA